MIQETVSTRRCAEGQVYIAQYVWLFPCYACLFLTRGHKHEQCHAVDSFDALRQISESNTAFSIFHSVQFVPWGKKDRLMNTVQI